MTLPQFSRRTPPSALRWAAAGTAAVLLHFLVLSLVFLWPSSPHRPKKKVPERQYLVRLQKPSAESRIPPETNRVSSENHATSRETRLEKPSEAPSEAPAHRAPARPAKPRAPATAQSGEPAASSSAETPGETKTEAKKPAETAADAKPAEAPAAPEGPIKLFPTDKEAEKILGIQPEIAPPDVASGAENAINSRQWIGASFFMRVREAVARTWDPEPVYRARDPDGRVYGYKNWLTVLTITLDAQGKLIEPIIISQPSGLRFLDLEAMRAVRAAAPFLNPPPEIVDASGHIKFRFGFLVEVNSGLNFRMFRF